MITLTRTLTYLGDDLVISVGAGKAHIGSCVIALPYEKEGSIHATLTTWNHLTHKDDEIASRYAKAMALYTNHTVICICGIHFDDISQSKIEEVIQRVEDDIKQLKKEYDNEHKV